MKRLFIALLIVVFIPVFSFAKVVNIPPNDPKCKDGDKAMCVQSCYQTAAYCGPFATFENGVFIDGTMSDCNTTTCSWNCFCVKVNN